MELAMDFPVEDSSKIVDIDLMQEDVGDDDTMADEDDLSQAMEEDMQNQYTSEPQDETITDIDHTVHDEVDLTNENMDDAPQDQQYVEISEHDLTSHGNDHIENSNKDSVEVVEVVELRDEIFDEGRPSGTVDAPQGAVVEEIKGTDGEDRQTEPRAGEGSSAPRLPKLNDEESAETAPIEGPETGKVEKTRSSQDVLSYIDSHPIPVIYDGNEMALFPHSGQQSETFLLQDKNLLNSSLKELFKAIRFVLDDSIPEDYDLELTIDELDLCLCENSVDCDAIPLSQVLALFLRLYRQDGYDSPNPMFINLSSITNFRARIKELEALASSGHGISSIASNSLAEAEDFEDEEEEEAKDARIVKGPQDSETISAKGDQDSKVSPGDETKSASISEHRERITEPSPVPQPVQSLNSLPTESWEVSDAAGTQAEEIAKDDEGSSREDDEAPPKKKDGEQYVIENVKEETLGVGNQAKSKAHEDPHISQESEANSAEDITKVEEDQFGESALEGYDEEELKEEFDESAEGLLNYGFEDKADQKDETHEPRTIHEQSEASSVTLHGDHENLDDDQSTVKETQDEISSKPVESRVPRSPENLDDEDHKYDEEDDTFEVDFEPEEDELLEATGLRKVEEASVNAELVEHDGQEQDESDSTRRDGSNNHSKITSYDNPNDPAFPVLPSEDNDTITYASDHALSPEAKNGAPGTTNKADIPRSATRLQAENGVEDVATHAAEDEFDYDDDQYDNNEAPSSERTQSHTVGAESKTRKRSFDEPNEEAELDSESPGSKRAKAS